jgi:hypothetical protein
MKYPIENLINAIESNFSSAEAAKRFNVPERTVRAHRQMPLQKIGAGRRRYLNDDQENHLVLLFQVLPDYGFALTADIAIKISSDYMKSLGIAAEPKLQWLKNFVKRHRMKIKWKKQEKLERIRALSFTEETRRGWFSLLKSTLEKLDLIDKPNQIFNADETGFSDKTNSKISIIFCSFNFFFFKGEYVIVNSSTRHTFEQNGGSGRKFTTALIAISAGGQVLPPFIVYSGKNLMSNWCKAGPPGTHYAVTEKVSIKICCSFILYNFIFFSGLD